jgi:hypothetical protein
MNCNKCNETIPNMVEVDGKMIRSARNRKYCFKCSPFGTHNTSKIENPIRKNISKDGLIEFSCSKCKNVLDISKFFIKKNGSPYCYCKECWRKLINDRLVERKKKLVDLAGGKCIICGYERYCGALEFHHKIPTEKEYTVSVKNVSMKILLKEINKCILLCANCHRELHAGIITLDKAEKIV